MSYVLPCNRPDFHQCLPKPREQWTLSDGMSKNTGLLVYVNAAGETAAVPSVWYNQPVEWRVEWYRFCAAEADKRALYWDKQRDRWAPQEAATARKKAVDLRALADKMEKTGEVLA